MSFTPPVKAMHYLLRHAVDIDRIIEHEQHSEVTQDLIGDILEGAAVFSRDVLAPLNWTGDDQDKRWAFGLWQSRERYRTARVTSKEGAPP